MYRMKREHFSLTAAVAGDRPDAVDVPTLRIAHTGRPAVLRDRLTDIDGSTLESGDIDVAFRKREGETGVLSIAERLTGAFIAELEGAIEDVTRVVESAEASEDGRYRIEIDTGDERVRFEKHTLLVYDTTGQLLRSCSLIPGSVEL